MGEAGINERLENALCDLYHGTGEIERLFNNSQLDTRNIEISGSDKVAMSRCLRAAEAQGELVSVINAAIRDKGETPQLRQLLYEIGSEKKVAQDELCSCIENLVRFRELLSEPRHFTRNELSECKTALRQIVGMREVARSLKADGDADGEPLEDLCRTIDDCLGEFQLYSELLGEAGKIPSQRVPGQPDTRTPLADIAADKRVLVDLKKNLSNAITETLRSARSLT